MKRLFFVLLLFLAGVGGKAQLIDSVKVYPQNPTVNDTITITCHVVYLKSCTFSSRELVSFGNEFWGKAFYCLGNFFVLSFEVDTFTINPLPPGNYTFNYWPGYDTVPPCNVPVDTGNNPIPYPYAMETILFSVTPVGLQDMGAANEQILIYPNPTTGVFTAQGATGELQVYDLFGRLVLRTNKKEIDMSHQPKGLYIVKVGEAVRKLVLN